MERLLAWVDKAALAWQRWRMWPCTKAARLTEDAEDIDGSIAALASHPGFMYLVQRLGRDKALLEATLVARRGSLPTTLDGVLKQAVEDARDSEGVFRIGWLQAMVLWRVKQAAERARK